jgi:hypothetical protein
MSSVDIHREKAKTKTDGLCQIAARDINKSVSMAGAGRSCAPPFHASRAHITTQNNFPKEEEEEE